MYRYLFINRTLKLNLLSTELKDKAVANALEVYSDLPLLGAARINADKICMFQLLRVPARQADLNRVNDS